MPIKCGLGESLFQGNGCKEMPQRAKRLVLMKWPQSTQNSYSFPHTPGRISCPGRKEHPDHLSPKSHSKGSPVMASLSLISIIPQEDDMEVDLPAPANSLWKKWRSNEKKAQNVEMRTQQAQEYDNSFPNLEFAQMIKEFWATWDCHPLTIYGWCYGRAQDMWLC